ncbi:MAG: M12 family metallopeptidase [Limisphaerales bacterium]
MAGRIHPAARAVWAWLFAVWLLAASPLLAGNFYAGITPATVPWPNGIVPYEFTNTLTAAMKQTYLDGLREWELAANVKFMPHTNQTRWILLTYNTNFLNTYYGDYNPQVIDISSLSRAQVGHEMGHSFGFNHENIRIDQTNYLTVIPGNVTSGNLPFLQIDPTTVTNGAYDFESVMHLGWDFASIQPGVLPTQQPNPAYFPRYQFRMGNFCLSPGDRAALAHLYGPPVVPLTNIVTTTADFGPGSLRAALYYITDNPAASIQFNIPTSDPGYSNGVFNIHLTGHLPPLAKNGIVIDGSTQPGFAGKPLIVVDGSQIIPETFTSNSGLLIYSSSNQVKNISFSGFNWNGLTLEYADATNNTVAGCWVGLDGNGSNAAPNAYQGIFLVNGAGHNVIGGTNANARNVISGNAQYGIWMSGSNTTGNIVLGNYIGTDAVGVMSLSNTAGGVILTDGTSGNIVGGTNVAARNVISGNVNAGLWIVGSGVFDNSIQGNFIGLDASGTAALPNTFAGMFVLDGASSNRITGNVISGNYSEGIRLADAGTAANLVQGNLIGTDFTGASAVPNGFAGLTIYSGATSNLIGGTSANARNVISGNYSYGAVVGNAGTSGNLIQGNYIGSGADGLEAVPNYSGVLFSDGATNNTLGGTTAGAANLVSGNSRYGVFISDAGTSGNWVQGNFIGTDRTGTNALGNYDNVELQAGATGNFIGGVTAGADNVIAFADGTGVILYDNGTTNNSIRGNSMFSNYYLGIDLNGDGVTPNHLGFLAGPNNFQNFPVITNAYGSGTGTVVSGNLNSLPDQSYVIDVYRNISPDDAGYGEGQFYLGSVSVTTDGSGNASFSLTNPTGNFAGQYFTATATSTGGDTSEFSAAVLATNQAVAFATFTGPYQARTNGFAFTLTLEPNFSYRIQATTNLSAKPVSWVDLTNFTATSAVFNFTDRTATNYNRRFYRVISP